MSKLHYYEFWDNLEQTFLMSAVMGFLCGPSVYHNLYGIYIININTGK